MLEVVAPAYEVVKTTLTIVRIAVPVVVALLVAARGGGGRAAPK
jgi:ABC-type transporter Mla maintaining outer membrane lipid asymmetry permease subunit MlaE